MSRSVIVGDDVEGGRVSINLDTLLRTRLLIQANSGGGKSWLLRRIAEQLFGRIPVLIIDPEGEFATLREKYGYVLVGQGGDTPARVDSAELVAQRLLELRASAVCDLYEMKPFQRHEWVSTFLGALIDAPKKLWQPLVVIVDEAHLFCPEKGAGESVASEAMTALTTRGRKRGYCPIWATQRLAKLRKDAAAELQNVLIGPTFMDADRERAADALGVSKGDRREFFDQIKLLPEGQFFGLGRAIALERVLVKVGSIQTTHPEPGSAKHSAAPPPPPEKVRALLPKLADLPAEAAVVAVTLADCGREITRLRRELVDAKRANPAPVAKVETKRVEVSVVKPADLTRAEKALLRSEKLSEDLQRSGQALLAELSGLATAIASAKVPDMAREGRPSPAAVPAGLSPGRAPVSPIRVGPPYRPTPNNPPPARRGSPSAAAPDSRIERAAERKVLAVLAQYPEGRSTRQIAILAGYAMGGGGFRNAMGRMRSLGFIVDQGSAVHITAAGLEALGPYDPLPTGHALAKHWLGQLDRKAEREVLAALIAAYPQALAVDEIARRAGYEARGGGFRNAMGKLRTLELIEGRGEVRASQDLFG